MSVTSICLFVIGIILALCSIPYKKKWEVVYPEKAVMGWAMLFVGGIMIALCSLVLSSDSQISDKCSCHCSCHTTCECIESETTSSKE